MVATYSTTPMPIAQVSKSSPTMATGLIVGESLFGVVFAGIVAASGSDAPLAIVGEDFETWAIGIGVVLYVVTILGLYRMTQRSAEDRSG